MTPLDQQIEDFKKLHPQAVFTKQSSGACLIEVPQYKMPAGWNRDLVTVLFLTPPGYPGAQPDCFWVEPGGVRLANDATPHGSNDSNPIPGVGSRGTWFSWHLQQWNPNRDTLETYFRVIEKRLYELR